MWCLVMVDWPWSPTISQPRFAQYLANSSGSIGSKSNWQRPPETRCRDRPMRLWTPRRLGRKGSQWLQSLWSCQPLHLRCWPHPRCDWEPLRLRPRRQGEPQRKPQREPQCQGCRCHWYHHCVWDKLGKLLGPRQWEQYLFWNALNPNKEKFWVLQTSAVLCALLLKQSLDFWRDIERPNVSKSYGRWLNPSWNFLGRKK